MCLVGFNDVLKFNIVCQSECWELPSKYIRLDFQTRRRQGQLQGLGVYQGRLPVGQHSQALLQGTAGAAHIERDEGQVRVEG